jgi:ATP-dependent Clp protease ATP-binding subunit ClpC
VKCHYDAENKRLAFDVKRAGLANQAGEGTPPTP